MASGTSSYEALSCGLPAILLSIVDNQISGAEGWKNLGAAVNLGPLETVKDSILIKAVISMISNFDERKRLSSLGMKLCDGRGASRLATAIESYL